MQSRISSLFAAAGLVLSTAPLVAQDLFIGCQLTLTGSQSQSGKLFRNSATIQVERLNAAGGIGGCKLQPLYEDSKSDPKQAVNIARKFVDDKRSLRLAFGPNPSLSFCPETSGSQY